MPQVPPALGCFTAPSTVQVAGNGGGSGSGSSSRRGGGGGTSAGSSGESSSGSSSGASSGSSSGGASGSGSSGGSSTGGGVVCGASGGNASNLIFDCNNFKNYDGDAGSCPGDWLGSRVIDFESCKPVCNAQVQAQGPDGVPIAGTAQLSDPATGLFHFCLPSSLTFEPTVTATGYSTFVYAEIEGQLEVDMPNFGMLSNEELDAFGGLLPNGGLQKADGALVVFILNTDNCGGGTAGGASTGWVFSLTGEDGGSYPDGGYSTLYIDSAGFPAPGPSTSAYGIGLLYNIDPAVAAFPTLQAQPPAGSRCTVINRQIGFTGRVLVGADLFSEAGIVVE